MYTYLIRCKDSSLYCGYSSDIERRVYEHKNKIGSKYTRAKGFSRLEMYILSESKSSAMKLEHFIKKLSKDEKERLIMGEYSILDKSNIKIIEIVKPN